MIDTGGPQITGITSNDGGGHTGLLEVGDTLTVTFNKSLASITSPATATEARAGSLLYVTDVTLAIPGITQSAADTGSGHYFGGCSGVIGLSLVCSAQSVTFTASIVVAGTGTSTTATVTVTSITGGGSTPTASSGVLVLTPAATITDTSGHPAPATAFTTPTAISLF
ncbi:MAG: hypothetical protein M3Y35_01555 [Actinomycetota bacterium]|nr:hypothetical protein [Actinomycetota bacterium]